MKYAKVLLFGLNILFSLASNAQNISVESITTLDGLSQNDVKSIYQDSQGFLWFATNDGICRYDGIRFKKVLKSRTGLSGGLIRKVVEDLDENLWIATFSGINRLNLRTGKVEEYFLANSGENSLLNNFINDIVCDKSGTIWYSTNSGIGKILKENGQFQVINITNNETKNKFYNSRLYVDKEERLWILAKGGLYFLDNGNILTAIKNENSDFLKIVALSKGYILVEKAKSYFCDLNAISRGEVELKVFLDYNINDLLIDKKGSCWVAAAKIHKYDISEINGDYTIDKISVVLDLNGLEVLSMFQDKTGIVYVGTLGEGIKKIDLTGKKFRHYIGIEKFSSGKIRAIFEDTDRNLYIGKESGRANGYVLSQSLFSEDITNWQQGIDNLGEIYCISEISFHNKKRAVLAGGGYYQSLRILEGDKIELPQFKGLVFSIAQTKNGLVWIATYGQGLHRFDPEGKIPDKAFKPGDKFAAISTDIIRSLCVDSKGDLWIGTANGINILEKKEQTKKNPAFTKIFHDPNKNNSLSWNYILPIIETSTKEIWIGTMGEGLNRFDGFDENDNPIFEIFTTEHGLPNNVIKAILEDDSGNLWISSNKGISKFNPVSKEFENFDIDNGLQDYEFSELAAYKLSTGELLFGGGNGFNAFFPNEIKKDESEAIPVFTGFSVLNKELTVGDAVSNKVILSEDINVIDELVNKYKNNSFSIQFASLHYSLPSKNKCMYMLEGFDNDWVIESSSNHAKYTNLKPGRYVFRLKASNSDGVWSSEEKRLSIIIKPPFWQTGYMFAFYGLLVILILIFFRKFSIIGIERKHELVLNDLEKKKEHEVTQMKFQFFTNISHEFKTPLTLIVNPLEQLINKKNLPKEDKLRSYLNVMLRNSKVLLRLINQLMDFRRIEMGTAKLYVQEGNLKEFLSDIYESFSSIALQKEVKFNFIVHSVTQKIWCDFDKLQKVLNNVLSNAFKFTEDGGEINLEFIEDNSEFITIIVSDNGIGIPEDEQKQLFNRFFQGNAITATKIQEGTGIGLAYTKSLLELMHGKIEFQSKLHEGTVFFIKLPKNKEVFKEEDFRLSELVEGSITKDVLANNKFSEEFVISDGLKMENDELCSILIIEDNKELSSFLEDFFSENYNVFIAYNGYEGLEKCKELNPDLIITDVAMPVMDGIEMTKQLKESYETSHIPIIMLTAQTSDQKQQKGLETGADVYLGKPINLSIISAQVYSLLKNRQSLRAKFRDKIKMVPSEISPSNRDEKFLTKILSIVEENISNPEFTVHKLAEQCEYSQITLNDKLYSLTGIKAKLFIRSIRLKRACQLLEQGDLSISEITYAVGFNDIPYFRRCFKIEFGCLPSEYKKKHSN